MEKKSWLKIWGVILATSGAMTVIDIHFLYNRFLSSRVIVVQVRVFLLAVVSSLLIVLVVRYLLLYQNH